MMLEEVFFGQEAQSVHTKFKLEAVKPVIEGGLSVAQTARNLGVSQSVLHRWKHPLSSDPIHAFPGIAYLKPEAEELRQLQLENARLRQEREIKKQSPSARST